MSSSINDQARPDHPAGRALLTARHSGERSVFGMFEEKGKTIPKKGEKK